MHQPFSKIVKIFVANTLSYLPKATFEKEKVL
jgi:hypothetical protein